MRDMKIESARSNAVLIDAELIGEDTIQRLARMFLSLIAEKKELSNGICRFAGAKA